MTITLAYFAWPLISLALFMRCALPVAISATVIGGYLLLPTQGGFDLPGLPPIDKITMPPLLALIYAAIFGSRSPDALPGWVPKSPLVLICIGMLLVGRLGTWLTNTDAFAIGVAFFPGLTLYDTIARLQGVLLLLLPFILGRKYFATPETQKTFMIVLVVAALGYSILALYEVRMSPQLNVMLYGYFPHDFGQHIRRGGFRPIVFLSHGLWVGIFFACALLAAFGLWRSEASPRKLYYLGAAVWLVMTLYLAKSFGAFVTSVMLVPLLVFMKPRVQVLVAGVIGALIMAYPILRGLDLVPVEMIVEWARGIEVDRALSLEFRLINEDILLARANERPLFGWGGWGRSFIYDFEGRRISVTDGYWIIVIGVGGWIQYLGEFGLLCLAPLILALRRKSYDISPITAALSVVLAVNLIDLIPNAGETALTWMMAGALAGRLELGRSTDLAVAPATSVKDARTDGPLDGPTAPAYRRDFNDPSHGTSRPVAALRKSGARDPAGKSGLSYARDFDRTDPKGKRRP